MGDKKDKDIIPRGNGKGEDEDIHIEVLDADDTPPSAIDPPARATEEISGLESQLVELRKEKEEIYDRLLRKHADFENFRKRTEKDRLQFQQYALSEFLAELIPILDNFERALSHPEEHGGPEYRKGVELIYRQLRDLMEKKGLRPIDTDGQPFDPNYHEAIARELRNDLPENTILEELQKGYFFRDKLLRPALVKVSFQSQDSAPEGQEKGEDDEEWQSNE